MTNVMTNADDREHGEMREESSDGINQKPPSEKTTRMMENDDFHHIRSDVFNLVFYDSETNSKTNYKMAAWQGEGTVARKLQHLMRTNNETI